MHKILKMSNTDLSRKIESVYDNIINNVNTFVIKYLTIDHKKTLSLVVFLQLKL